MSANLSACADIYLTTEKKQRSTCIDFFKGDSEEVTGGSKRSALRKLVSSDH